MGQAKAAARKVKVTYSEIFKPILTLQDSIAHNKEYDFDPKEYTVGKPEGKQFIVFFSLFIIVTSIGEFTTHDFIILLLIFIFKSLNLYNEKEIEYLMNVLKQISEALQSVDRIVEGECQLGGQFHFYLETQVAIIKLSSLSLIILQYSTASYFFLLSVEE